MTGPSQLRSRLLEATAIVLSILLAFAIDAWWQQIVERREEIQLLSALRTEFAVNLERVAEISAFHADLRATAEALLSAAADSGSKPDADSVAKLIADVSWWGGFTGFESATLSAVILGGKLDLIQNEDLGSQLTAWQHHVATTAGQEAQEFTHFFDVWLPLLRLNSNLAQIANTGTSAPGGIVEYTYGQLPVPSPRVDHRELLANREFQNALVQKIWIEEDLLRQYRLLEPRVSEIIQALDEEIAR